MLLHPDRTSFVLISFRTVDTELPSEPAPEPVNVMAFLRRLQAASAPRPVSPSDTSTLEAEPSSNPAPTPVAPLHVAAGDMSIVQPTVRGTGSFRLRTSRHHHLPALVLSALHRMLLQLHAAPFVLHPSSLPDNQSMHPQRANWCLSLRLHMIHIQDHQSTGCSSPSLCRVCLQVVADETKAPNDAVPDATLSIEVIISDSMPPR